MAGVYVEVIRNLPLLLQLLFWYNAVLKALPERVDESWLIFGGFLNRRGLFLPQPLAREGFGAVVIALLVGVVADDRVPHLGGQAPGAYRRACAGALGGDGV